MCLIWETCGLLRQTGPKVQKNGKSWWPFSIFCFKQINALCAHDCSFAIFTNVFLAIIPPPSPCHLFLPWAIAGYVRGDNNGSFVRRFFLFSRDMGRRERKRHKIYIMALFPPLSSPPLLRPSQDKEMPGIVPFRQRMPPPIQKNYVFLCFS